MKLKKLNKALLTGVVALTATTGLIASTMTTASADPTRPYAATGSDTIQDVWNGLTNDFGAVAPSISSYNAFVSLPTGVTDASGGVSYIQTKTGGAWFQRPNGSGDGMKSLSAVWDPGFASHQWPAGSGNALTHEEVDFARSSGGPSAGAGLKFLPFARDAVSIAYNPEAGLAAGLNLTTGQIAELYSGNDNTGDSVVTFTGPTNPATAATHVFINGAEVHPKIPQSGSGTRKFFLGAIGVSTLAAYIPVNNNTLATGGLPENDGTQIPNDGDLICFSAAQWIAQANGKSTNTTGNLELASINSADAITSAAGVLSPGPLFGATNPSGKYNVVPSTGVGAFNRDTYNIVPASFIGSSVAKQTALVGLLGAGIGGAGGSGVIKAYGFGVLSYIGTSSNFLDGAWQH
jgi:hypothetical protein